jgi:hypothetical protein
MPYTPFRAQVQRHGQATASAFRSYDHAIRVFSSKPSQKRKGTKPRSPISLHRGFLLRCTTFLTTVMHCICTISITYGSRWPNSTAPSRSLSSARQVVCTALECRCCWPNGSREPQSQTVVAFSAAGSESGNVRISNGHRPASTSTGHPSSQMPAYGTRPC